MRNKTNHQLIVGVASAAAAVAGVSLAGDNTPSNDTDARIAALEQQISELKTERNANWLTDDRAEEIRALVDEAVNDANGRRSLLANGGSAGWDNGFYLMSDDGSFKLKIEGQVQTRLVINEADERSTSGDDDDSINGFEIRRAKLGFGGNLFGQDFTYKVKGAFNRNGGDFELEDAWGAYRFSDTSQIKWGQFKAPFLREELTSSSRLLAVDRAYATEQTTGNFTQGVQWNLDMSDDFRVMFGPNDGWDISLTAPNSGYSNTRFMDSDTELAFTARAEWKNGESWKQFKDYQSWSDDEFGMLIGGAIHWQKSERDDLSGAFIDDEVDWFVWTIDAAFEFGGSHVEGWVVGQHSDTATPGAIDQDQYAWGVQGGFFVTPDEFELFARWDRFDWDSAQPSSFDSEIDMFTFGFNWFWEGHAKKWTTDLIYVDGALPYGNSDLGLLSDSNPENDDQVVIRSQLQFLF